MRRSCCGLDPISCPPSTSQFLEQRLSLSTTCIIHHRLSSVNPSSTVSPTYFRFLRGKARRFTLASPFSFPSTFSADTPKGSPISRQWQPFHVIFSLSTFSPKGSPFFRRQQLPSPRIVTFSTLTPNRRKARRFLQAIIGSPFTLSFQHQHGTSWLGGPDPSGWSGIFCGRLSNSL